MKIINGIPHWVKGGLALPVMAGGQFDTAAPGTGADGNVFQGDLFNLDGTFFGTLVQRPSGRLFISRQTPTGTTNLTEFTGGSFLTAFNEGITLSREGIITSSRDLPFPTGGDGTTSFSSTQAAQTQSEQAARDAAKLLADTRVQELEDIRIQDELDRELRLRESRLTTARDLVGIRSAEAREARTQGTSIAGEDFARFLAVSRGLQPPTGTTPAAGFKQNLMGAAQFQAPDLTGLDSAALESVIGKLSQPITPTQGPFGFAHGGTVSPRGGVMQGSGSQAIKVGEAGPEIMILRPDGSVEVVPMAGSAQGGGVFDLGGFGPLFSRLRESIGAPGEAGFRPPNIGGGFSGLPHTQFRSMFGFLPVANNQFSEQETSAPFQAFGGPILNIRQGLGEALGFQNVPNAAAEAQRISNLIGLLPNPIKIPPTFFQSLLPAEQNALVSAYRLSGVPEDDFRHLRTAPLLSATPTPATAIG